jgi:cyclic beta-1,2-glucan synthetase
LPALYSGKANLQHSVVRALRGRFQVSVQDSAELLRAELFGVERFEQHAESLAAAQRITNQPKTGRRLAARLRDNSRVLVAAYRTIAESIREERAITPAAEWLVDNFHAVEEQIRVIRDDLPPGYYQQLPKLADGPLEGYPRVYGLAWAFVAHTDSRFDPELLCRFVRAYQKVQPLTIGELWAVAITLRIILVENLRRAAERIVGSRAARQDADALADQLLGVGIRQTETPETALARLERAPLPRAFAVQLVQRLRDQDPKVTPALQWLDRRLEAQGTTADEIVQEEHLGQGAMNVTVRNVVTSMRLISSADWAELFESVSLVDAALSTDYDFAAMDFPTRDRYRHAVEELARGSGHTELEVARSAIAAAGRSAPEPPIEGDATRRRQHDPGYYLISNGRREFEREIGFRPPVKDWYKRASAAAGIAGYLGTIALLSACILSLPLMVAINAGTAALALVFLVLLALVPATDLAIALVNRDVTSRHEPELLPGLALRDGVPSSLRTMVAVPTMLTTCADVEAQIERLEVRYLSSADGEISFALLSDWTDSPTETASGDQELVAAAAHGITRLNQRYGPGADGERFFLFHRRRVWNESEGAWMGWERKRGKLHELNRLLRGATDTSFVAAQGDTLAVPAGVRYVITLDADTLLPRGAARRMVGKMAHPLNRPRLDQCSGRVIEGYAVLQPRVTPCLPADHEGSLFQRVFSGPPGIDPYAFAVSDVYQDLFGEGSYSGKGIYDVDVFETALKGRVGDNTLLSHDLFEGIFARAGLASDIEVIEEFPARYDVAAAREHRWARGDWQLIPWIVGRGRGSDKGGSPSAIPLIARWKMADNLRRTLSAPMLMLALLAGWMLPLSSAAVWTGFLVATIAVPRLLPFFAAVVPHGHGISKRSHLRAVVTDLALGSSQIALLIAFLAHQAWLMSDAIVRTLFRTFVTHRLMLEWVTAAQAKLTRRLDLQGFCRRMAPAVALAALVAIIVAYAAPWSMALAAPFVILWVLSPAIARWVSLPPPRQGLNPISAADAEALRLGARRTWRFFETFVTAKDNMLAPDNFQEEPKPVLAHRTSPTNIGLYLLSTVAARDFGWTGIFEAAERLDTAFTSMNQLERFRGHFYNWYDTVDLHPLEPKYVSSVDSGNLAGALIALGNACREMISGPVISPQWMAGIADALKLTRQSLGVLTDNKRTSTVTLKQLYDEVDAAAALLRSAPLTPASVAARLKELALHAATIADIARTLIGERADAATEVLTWVEAMRASIGSHQRDVERLMPWAPLLAEDPPHLSAASDSRWPASLRQILAPLSGSVSALADLPQRCDAAIRTLRHHRLEITAPGEVEYLEQVDTLLKALEHSAAEVQMLERRLAALSSLAQKLFEAMEFGFLYNPQRQLLSIGYRVTDGSLDANCYDLLASEARLASFIAIAKGDVPVRHWFRLGRDVTPVDRGLALISWSGSMFEYLMPSLLMREPSGGLLDHTGRLAVARQIEYGAELGIPWGVSESAFNARDPELTYQYMGFGVPGLGLKRGLNQDFVIAPYATGLATMVDAKAAVRNFSRLAAAGGLGPYGWYEALDYTPSRIPAGNGVAIVRAYMAHHQGMTLVAIADALNDGSMRTRFHSEPIVQATELLLQERIPRDVAVARPRAEEVAAAATVRELAVPISRRFHSPHDRIPRTHLLSNGSYAVMITAAGSGYSRWRDLALTRWQEDVTCDSWGSYVFLRDTRGGEVWSAGYQPSGVQPDTYDVMFCEDRAEITRRDGSITTTMEIAVSQDTNAEVRRVSVTNLGSRTREIELTSYAEVVLAAPAADTAHPAFSKMFVQTEFVADIGAILATRRLRSPSEAQVWAAHLVVVEAQSVGDLQFETDRARFLGSGRGIRTPISVIDGQSLSNTAGTVLDPIFSLRSRVRIAPGATARLAFWTLVAPSRSEVLDLADKHREPAAFDRAVTLAWTQAQVQLYHLGVGPAEADLFQRLASHVLYSDPAMRPSSNLLLRNQHPQSMLWSLGISGDLPIVLVRIDEVEDLEIVRQLYRAHEYWRMKQLAVDLVIINERPSSYVQELQASLEALVRANQSRPSPSAEGTLLGGVFVLRADIVSVEARNLLQSAARVVLLSRWGSLSQQIKRLEKSVPASMVPSKRSPGAAKEPPRPARLRPELEFFNGLGGFAEDGREYVTILDEGQWTPAPWINVIANGAFGFQVSALGSGYTWSINSRENQITPWSNDPVSDRPGEIIYVRDEDSGDVWGPTALPIREESSSYVARHGQGYSRFENDSHGISLRLEQFVPMDDSIRISRLKIRNLSGRPRGLSVTAYVEWVLGTSRGASAPFVVTEVDSETGAMLARNPWSIQFGTRVAFADLAGRKMTWTADRTEFIGRNGTLVKPAALAGDTPLSNRVGAGLDPCGALQTRIDLKPNDTVEVVFLLGEAATRADAVSLISRYRAADLDAVLRAVTQHWDEVLGVVAVKTPDRSMDLLLNSWLLYQTLACRILARSAFYQASGAYGFRDQLQDVMALTVAQPNLTREHLLRAAARQFAQGDVQHWWLPPTGQGVRTRITDDRLWLPYATAHYVEVTGDKGVLDELVPFVEGPALHPEEDDSFFQPTVSAEQVSLFEHCSRAIDSSLLTGGHGLPLFGSGDWNDGMNRVGKAGKGESIWLGWFLHATISAFAPIANDRGEDARVTNWRRHASTLRESLERDGWDGEWYRRGYFDDGTALGSASSSECQIDSIAQSWGVISTAADPARAATAMAAVDKHLIRRADGLALLFAPPFDRTSLDPGYIKGYPPGIRENGGQYTHAAIWSILAFAMLGEGDQAGELFSMLNPINHANTRLAIHRYQVEPYVMSADVYAAPAHVGRGGWTWYTGSAGWMYRAGLEWILGFRLRGSTLVIDPCIPKDWRGFDIVFKYHSTRYEIAIENPRGVSRGVSELTLDSEKIPQSQLGLPLADDGVTHRVRAVLG